MGYGLFYLMLYFYIYYVQLNKGVVMEDNDRLYESVGNYTKYKLVEMLIDKY